MGEQRGKFYAELVEDLIVFVEHEARLDRKKDDGASEREHLESAQRQIKNLPGWKGTKAEQIVPEPPPIPREIAYLYFLFGEFCFALEQNGMGPAAATWQNLESWAELMRRYLDPWEFFAIVRLCHARAVIHGEKMEKEAKAKRDAAPKPRKK